jgi:hypothetical protein
MDKQDEIIQKLDELLKVKELLITEKDLAWVGCYITKQSGENGFVEYGFPFNNHEQNREKAFIVVKSEPNPNYIKEIILFFIRGKVNDTTPPADSPTTK